MAKNSTPLALPPGVALAFGASDAPVRLAGGRGLTWRSGRIVLRPTADPVEASWKSDVLADINCSLEFTVPRPLRDGQGAWVRNGWQASEWVPGAADECRVQDVITAGDGFHRAIAGLPCPDFIAAATDPWSQADRIAWREAALPADGLLELLVGEYQPVDALPQVIHGDLLGNVLFAEGRPPAIIDWAPYWRPSGLGAAIAVADAACWHAYPLSALAEDHGVSQWRQLLLRALVFRIATMHLLGSWNALQLRRHLPVAAAIIALSH